MTVLQPFFKWAGNKRDLVQKHPELFPAPETVKRLVLPFCGSAAVAFLYPGVEMYLSDTNPYLMVALKAVRDDVGWLLERLTYEEKQYGAKRYAHHVDRLNRIGRPSLFFNLVDQVDIAVSTFVVIFWGYNGLWRTNKDGKINVPFGKTASGKPPRLFDPAQLRACSAALSNAKFAIRDFERAVVEGPAPSHRLWELGHHDFCYFDSPFLETFAGYGADGFGLAEHERLARLLPALDAAGVRWALSNSYTPKSLELFAKPEWNIARVQRSGSINSKASARGKVWELFVRNY